MRKIVLLIVVLFCLSNSYCQNRDVDSLSIGFKAKLFTVSEYGIADKDQILEDIENQKIKFLNTKYDNFIFIKVYFSQPFRIPGNRTQTLYRDCSYYLAYNTLDPTFYKLGGFNSVDIDSFFTALKANESSIFKDFGAKSEEIEEIDIHCLYDYYKMKKKKRFKKGFNCLDNCSKKTKTKITTYDGGRYSNKG
ncbi:hypothetical protein [Winogradskyella sp.]|uniref:hypothetical protein n=1 Tax=Winogradskyella sp. TaxID=1883156 RepID=UPI001AFF92A7|nr:hypothetical protein [Winogradskyella sp.]MBO6879079.1 hypothetical protein [Winogradskyella sp.]